ncbi:MAG: hypothetical protein QW814_03470 [Methanothrix sp.]
MAFVVVDLDGCLVDDVHETFSKFLRRDDSRTEHVFKELIFNVLDRIPSVVDSVAKRIDIEKGLNMHVVKALKTVYDAGFDVVVRTANRKLGTLGIERIKSALKDYGINASVELTEDKYKYAERNGEKPVLLLDDKPNVVINAARKGIRSILISADYNRVAGFFIKGVNDLVSISTPESMDKACIKALRQRTTA